MQAVFDREGKTIVFVKTPTGFEAREVTAARRTESTMVIASGLKPCLLYTSDAADERSSVDLGGRRIIKKKKNTVLGAYRTKKSYKKPSIMRVLYHRSLCRMI